MSEREQVETTRQCPDCGGRGTEADYVGLEMRCVEVECSTCGGTGRLPAPVSQPVAKEFSYFRCLSCGYSGTITEEEIAKHRERCAHGPTVAVDPSPQAEPEPQCVICDSPACSLSANGKYYCSQDKPSWQEEEIEVSSEPKPSPQAEPSKTPKIVATIHLVYVVVLLLIVFLNAKHQQSESGSHVTIRHHYQEDQLLADPPLPMQKRS